MKAGATKDYDFGQKNHWRRTIWNEMLRRTNGREKRESIIYLAGPDDLDRKVAMSKGVPSDRMVAIDRNRQNVESIRKNKVPALCGDVIEVMKAWPNSSPVCLIYLDFCGGLLSTKKLQSVAEHWLLSPPLRTAVLAVNMQRGRESGTANVLRKTAENFIDKYMEWPVEPLHRGAQWTMQMIVHMMRAIMAIGTDRELKKPILPLIEGLTRELSPSFFTYRSGPLVLDSCVLNHMGDVFKTEDVLFMIPATNDVVGLSPQQFLRTSYQVNERIKARVNATLAIRTMRANAGA